jgi:hypothetical protein
MKATNRNAAGEARGVPKTDQLGGEVNQENSLASGPVQGQRGGRRSRAKGYRIERAPLPQPRAACDPRCQEMIERTYRCAAHSTVNRQMAVYDGRDCLGSITINEAGEAHAFALNGARLGSFPDLKSALAAFPAKESGKGFGVAVVSTGAVPC